MNTKNEGDLAKSVKGTIWLSAGSLVDYVFNIIITYFLARLLTPNDYGEVTAITVLVGFADIFWQIGLAQSLIQKKDLTDKDITTGFYINLVLVVFITSLIWFFTPFWQSTFSISNGWMLRTYAFVFLIEGFLAIPTAILQRKLLFKKVSLANIISHFVYGIAVVIMAFCGLGPWALVYGILVRYVVRAILLMYQQPISYNPRLVNRETAYVLLNFSGGFTLGKICNYVATNGDYFVINKTLGKSSLGFYQKAYSLLMYPTNLIGTNLEQVFYPLFSKNQDNNEKCGKAFIAGNVFISIIAAPISLISFLVAEPLINVFLGSQWAAAVIPFKIMIVGLFFRTAYKLSISLIKSQGKVYKYASIEFLYALLIVVFAYIGHFYGVSGVAFGTTLAFISNFFMLLFAAEKYVNFGLLKFCRDVFVPYLYIIPFCFIASLLKPIIFDVFNDLFQCIAYTIIILPTYFFCIWKTRKFVLTSMTCEMLEKITSMFIKLIKRKKNIY